MVALARQVVHDLSLRQTVNVESQDRPLHILCAEDEDAPFQQVSHHLRTAKRAPKHQLIRVKTLKEALRALHAENSHFDLIFADLSLPDSEGEQTFTSLQRAAPEVAIAVLTAPDDHESGLHLVKMGAQEYLCKDELTPGLLVRAILQAIERKRHQVELERLNHELQEATENLRAAQLHLIQAEKLESLGRMAAGIAHEVKNPLAMIQMAVDFFKNRASGDDKEEFMLGAMQESLHRATRIVSEMQDFSRSRDLELKPIDLNEVIEKALAFVAHELQRAEIEIIRDLTPQLPATAMDRMKIEQVLINLLHNSSHAIEKRGRIKVRSYQGTVDHMLLNEGLRTLEHLREGDEVVVAEIRDYGPGIPPDKLPYIFDPFFTTKPTGKGTGLGLSICKTIVEMHGGLLRIHNVHPPGVRAQVILRCTVPSKTQAG